MSEKVYISDLISAYSLRNTENRSLPVYSVTNSHGFTLSTEYFNKKVFSKDTSNYKIVPFGAFAYNPSRINVGSISWQDKEKEVIVSPLYNVFTLKHNVDARYLNYFFHSPYCMTYINAYATGSVRNTLDLKSLGKIPIILPEEKEQKRVVKILDCLIKIITHRKQALELMNELVKSRFVEMFGDPVFNPKEWPIYELSKYIQFLTSGSRGWSQYFTDNGEYFITIKNVKNCQVILNDVQYVVPPHNAEAKRTRVQEGDLLISITADLGRTGVVTREIADHGGYINQHLTCVRLDRSAVRPLYVAFYMESEAGKRQFQTKNQSAVKAGLNFHSIKTLQIMVPPIELQDSFIVFVKEIHKSRLLFKCQLLQYHSIEDIIRGRNYG